MKGLILVNAYYDSEEYLYCAERLKAEFLRKNVSADVIKNDAFLLTIENGDIVSRVREYDFCVYLDKDKYILSMLDKIGMPLFNSRQAIEICDDKMQTYIALAGNSIPIPKTFAGLLCYTKNATIKPETLEKAEALGYPIIVKESFGSQGSGVHLAKNRTELTAAMEKVKCKPHLIQEYISTSTGKDVRVIVIGGKAVGGMLRHSENDFRSNIGAGGTAEPYALPDDMKFLAEKTAIILGLDYCGIDVLFGKNSPIICEVNSNAFFYAFEKTTGINVAEKYVERILTTINVP